MFSFFVWNNIPLFVSVSVQKHTWETQILSHWEEKEGEEGSGAFPNVCVFPSPGSLEIMGRGKRYDLSCFCIHKGLAKSRSSSYHTSSWLSFYEWTPGTCLASNTTNERKTVVHSHDLNKSKPERASKGFLARQVSSIHSRLFCFCFFTFVLT